MESLESLITSLGIPEHMAALSDWRDAFLREKAVELQAVRLEADKAVAAAKEQFTTSAETLAANHAAELTSLREQLAAATAPPAAPPVLSQLATVFGSLEPAIQRAFASAFATVRTLIQADQVGLARGYIEDLDVPEELAETKAGILSMLA